MVDVQDNQYSYKLRPKYTNQLHSDLSEYISVQVTPQISYNLDIMKIGVMKDIDRDYTFDVIPNELIGGILYQPEHRIPLGTSIKLNIIKPITIYFIFHNECDGNYTNLFKSLPNWEKCDNAPQYDLEGKNGDPTHGLHMTMYKLNAVPGVYNIPKGEWGSKVNWACWNLVFKL
jgi:hypothetical protein